MKQQHNGQILVVEDDTTLRAALCDTLKAAHFSVLEASNGQSALTVLSNEQVDVVISDVQMPSMDGNALLDNVVSLWPSTPLVLMTAYAEISAAVSAIHRGAVDYLVKPFEAKTLIDLISRLVSVTKQKAVIAEDPKTQALMDFVSRVAASEANVMITGESGSGKEVFARMIHDQSNRCNAPFVAINCAAIPESMLEAVLFGHEKGAFTGATQSQQGKFELANKGTLLLDEISEMDLSLQSKLLRVLQEKEVERLGSHTVINLDLRVLATSNRNLVEEVAAGRFREDLYYRLNVIPLAVPPLRERPEDILPLAKFFLEKYATGRSCNFAESAKMAIHRHTWPGNIRELENVVQRALVMQVGESITAEDLHFSQIPGGQQDQSVSETGAGNKSETGLKGNEQNLILEVLREERGSRKDTAERLGISPRTLRYKLAKFKELGVEVP
ncbi:MAG: sigma-54-dependent Fis family transcriptional regulator [Gammaproteobacteria bacterium]|nr:sigma-54-dependent Fis family transcriptional regulator [Gammaproteobacteria bacterium]MBT6893689.1 sigma-54-dependent Fis family transcriptional regulator [Gammaproteobacteria bacterium]